jgi:hypothetical protein
MMSRWLRQGGRWAGGLLGAAVCALALSGCVHRQLVITTDVPGTVVQVNGKTIGATPVDYPFTYYGDYHIRLMRDGFETQEVLQPVPAPWYQWPGIDFISENVIPWTITDIHRPHYIMRPLQAEDPEAVGRRAEMFRQKGRTVGPPEPPPAVVTPGQPAPGGIVAPPGEPLPQPNPVPPADRNPFFPGGQPVR